MRKQTATNDDMKDSVLAHLRIVKRKSGYTYKDIADLSDGLMSEKTVERLFNGKAPMTTARFDFLDSIMDMQMYFQSTIAGPGELSHIVVAEVLELPRHQQQLILQLCREMKLNANSKN